ncbi:hypothetical protein ACFL43_03655 [Thermodesulfobacteriota bacterium]
MMRVCSILFLLLVLLSSAALLHGAGLPSDEAIEFELYINDRFHTLHDFFNSGSRKFNQDRDLHILYVNPYVAAPLGSYAYGVLELEAEFLFDFHNHAGDDTIEVRNAYIQALAPGCDWIALTAGRQAISTLDGLLYDDNSLAISLHADMERGLDLPLKLRALFTEVEHDSPYFHAELKYNFDFLESVTLSYSWFRDTNDGIARIFDYLEQERRYGSRGKLHWLGLSVRKFLGDALLRTTCIFGRGTVHLRQPGQGTRTMRVRSYLIDINLDYSLTERLSLSAFFFLSSGDKQPGQGTLRSFVSIDPYVDKTNIFFNGGIDGQFSSDNVGLNGIQLPGVMAPGLVIDYRDGNRFSIKCILAYLLTHKGTGGQGHRYGWEADLMGYYNLRENIQLFAELNVFEPGDYFRRLTDHRDHISTEFICGVTYYFSR